jgi:predicted SAM-dependent methyltransferase
MIGHRFVQDDVTKLEKFENDSVDEITAMHLLEHIPVYKIDETLIRWHEVLRKDGFVIVEMPCIIKSCVNTLQLLTTKDSNLTHFLGLVGIFGEPDPKNTFMEHKWGWTFETLQQQFRNAGFVNIREEQPMTHRGPVRDFRLVAQKG